MYQDVKAKCKVPVPGKRSLDGQSLVEFALTLPLLMLILLGVLDLGRLFFAYIAINNAAREGARYGAEFPWDPAGAISHAQQEPDNLVTVTTITSPLCTFDQYGRPITNSLGIINPVGTPITVTVQSTFTLMTAYIFGGGQIPMSASNSWQIFHSCYH